MLGLVLKPFWLSIVPQKSNLWLTTDAPTRHARGGKRRIRELQDRCPYTIRGGGHSLWRPVTTTPLHFPQLMWLRIYGGCYMKMCSTAWTKDLTYIPWKSLQSFVIFITFRNKKKIGRNITCIWSLECWRSCQETPLLLSYSPPLLFEFSKLVSFGYFSWLNDFVYFIIMSK